LRPRLASVIAVAQPGYEVNYFATKHGIPSAGLEEKAAW
jgi:hypothetical protein